jgi:hypothetical protein
MSSGPEGHIMPFSNRPDICQRLSSFVCRFNWPWHRRRVHICQLIPCDRDSEAERCVATLVTLLCRRGKAGDFPPSVESLAHLLAVLGGRQPMPSRSAMRGNGAIRGEKALGMTR